MEAFLFLSQETATACATSSFDSSLALKPAWEVVKELDGYTMNGVTSLTFPTTNSQTHFAGVEFQLISVLTWETEKAPRMESGLCPL